jgi:hypothetical protein
MKKKFLVTRIGDVRFYAKHQVLRELILLISKQADISTDEQINIFIGIHHWMADILPKNAINIGIQTEQFFDANGQVLWGSLHSAHLKAACLKFDVILDLTEFNKPAYQNFDKYNRVVFGPYIFPKEQFSPLIEKSSEVCFVGALNERRRRIISEVSNQYSIKIIKNEFGEKLNQSVSRGTAILNIHFQEGVYAEWPRILLAYVNGKILLSEELGHPLSLGRHYCALDSDLAAVNFAEIHKNIYEDFAKKYSFSKFINSRNFKKIQLQFSENLYLLRLIITLRASRFLNKFLFQVK